MNRIQKRVYALAALALSAVLVSGCGTDDAKSTETTTSTTQAADRPSADGKGFYAPVNGLQLYYESHGTGQPLVLIHGGLGTVDSTFPTLLPELAKTRRVIAVELQAHGHTADTNRPLRYDLLADDIAGLITHLGLGRADVLGYSLGGGVALQLASRTPDLVNKLAIVSATYRSDGWLPETRAGMAAIDPAAMLNTPIHDAYTRTAPNPGDWPTLATKTRQLLTEDFDWTTQIASITAPTLFMTAENDALYLDHARKLVDLLGTATGAAPATRLEIMPGTTHYDIMYRADLLVPVITPFLDAPSGGAK